MSFIPELYFLFSIYFIFFFFTLRNYSSTLSYITNDTIIYVLYLLSVISTILLLTTDTYYDFLYSATFVRKTYVSNGLSLLLYVFFFFIILSVKNYFSFLKLSCGVYLFVMSNAVFCLSCLVHTNHFFFSFILLECVSICLYLLCGYNKKDIDSIEAALKYFIIGTFSSILLLLGISLLYGVFGSVQFDDLRMFISYELYNPILKFEVVACFIFIALGLLIKTYSAPFHYWALDIYEGAPLTSSFFFSTVYLLSIIYFFLKLYLFFFIKFDIFQYYFLFFSLNCFFFGTFGTLFQTKIRKLLAYSSVNTVGFVLLAFSTLDLENVEYSIIVLASYLINTSCLFSVLISVPITSFGELRTINKLNDFSLLHNSNSFLSFFVAFSFFFSSGLPPFVYFLYKSFFFSSLLQSYYLIIVLLLVLFSICSYFYFLRIVKVIYYSNPISSMSFNGVSKVTTLGAILMTFFMTLNVLLFCFFELFSYYALLIVLSI